MPINTPASDDADRISSEPLSVILNKLRELRAEVPKMTRQEIVELIAEGRRQRLRETIQP